MGMGGANDPSMAFQSRHLLQQRTVRYVGRPGYADRLPRPSAACGV